MWIEKKLAIYCSPLKMMATPRRIIKRLPNIFMWIIVYLGITENTLAGVTVSKGNFMKKFSEIILILLTCSLLLQSPG